jgi:glycosyltransferase involved in cell wall biosynthesis
MSGPPGRTGPDTSGRRLRILHAFKIFYPEVYGGIPYAIEQAMAVRPDLFDHQLLVCSTAPDAPENQMDRVERVRSFGDLFSLPIAPLYPFRLWQKMKSADLVILHAPFPLADLVLGLGFRSKVPLIVYWHSDIVSQKFFGKLLRPLLMATLRRAKAILLSDERILHRRELAKAFGHKLVSLPYPIDLDRFVLSGDEKEQVAALKARYPRLVLSVGRLVKYKGYDVLIEAAKSVDATFLVVGEGVERPALQAAIDAAGLQERVRLIGALNERDLIVHLHAADVFAMPSVSNAETFGIAQLEAMAAGTPVVNTRLDTMVPLLARDGVEGTTVRPGDANALAFAIAAHLNDCSLYNRLAKNAAERVQEFSTIAFGESFQASVLDAVQAPETAR